MRTRPQIIAACKAPVDLSREGSSRPQYSIKSKKKFAKYVVRHGLSIQEARLASGGKLSATQVSSWVSDYKDGRYDLKHSVCVSRS